MKEKAKSRLCWNCQGSVSFETENCTYCGVYLSPSLGDDQDTQNLFAPPYRLEESAESAEETTEAPYVPMQEKREDPFNETGALSSTPTHPFLSLTALLTGFVFLFFGLALVLFSQDGALTLQWDSTYWYLYLVVALPLLIWGWREVEKHRDQT